ncbi:MAG: hypothetical protein HY261_07925, partial [Chloroflexi bacterium]|nr:hypothetical protein [Chloroflexota bacterium]
MRRNVQPKRVSGREAIRAIPQRARLLFPPSCGVTVSLLDALYEERGRFEDLRLFTGLIFVEHPVWQHLGGNIKLSTWHIAAAVQKSVDEGKADWFPIRMSQVASLFAQDGPLAVDAVLVQVSPPDEQGYVSLGAHV